MSPPGPYDYARCKLPTLRRRWDGPEGEAVRAYGRDVWPGVPPTALLGLSASSMGLGEVVGDGDAMASAVGLFGVERPRVQLYTDESTAEGRAVKAVLGRPARAGLTVSGYLGDVAGQVVSGLLNYRWHFDALARLLPRGVLRGVPVTTASSLEVRLAAAAYSSGENVPAAGLGAFADALEAVSWDLRWATYAGKVAATPEATLGGVPVDGRWKIAFNIVRAEQRLCSGELLEESVNGSGGLVWWHPWVAPASAPVVERLLTRGGFDRTSTCSGGSAGPGGASPPAAGDGGGLGGFVVAGAVAWAAWQVFKGGR